MWEFKWCILIYRLTTFLEGPKLLTVTVPLTNAHTHSHSAAEYLRQPKTTRTNQDQVQRSTALPLHHGHPKLIKTNC